MKIELEKATASDAAAILTMQKSAFLPLLQKCRDRETNPANETVERILIRINSPGSFYYKILFQGRMVGAIRVKSDKGRRFWISPLFIDPPYQGLGIAGKAMHLTELLHAEAETWELATILQEEANCRFYEKLGYKATGATDRLNDSATLGYFRKPVKGVD